MSKKRSKSHDIWEVLKKIGLIVGILAGIVTIVKCFCTNDYSEDIKNAVAEIRKQSFVMEQMPDSLLATPTVKQARDVQEQLLSLKDRIDHFDFMPRDNENTPTALYRYINEMESFQTLCDEIVKANDLFSAFVANNPQYGIMFKLEEYKKKTNREKELTTKIGEDIKESLGQDKSPEKKVKILEKALNSEEMYDFLTIRKEILLLVFDYLNKVQVEIKLNGYK